MSTDKRPSVSPDALITELRDAANDNETPGWLSNLCDRAVDALEAASTDTTALPEFNETYDHLNRYHEEPDCLICDDIEFPICAEHSAALDTTKENGEQC